MTTKPKAKKFRIKRPTSPAASRAAEPVAVQKPQQPAAQQPAAQQPTAQQPTAQRQAPPQQPAPQRQQAPQQQAPQAAQQQRRPAAATPFPAASDAQLAQPQQPAQQPQTARSGEVSSAAQVAGETDIDTIRREGLTGRQLRMARRVAQKHGLAPTSDFDAVRQLRQRGIDPFQRSNMLELVVPQDGGPAKPAPAAGAGAAATGAALAKITPTQLPQTVPAGGANLPSTHQISPAERRNREISEIQRDITRRRRRKMGLLLTRLAFFVFLPTFLAGYYFYSMATPMYATNSQFLIIQNEGSGGTSPLGGLLPSQFAASQDSIATQGYLQSKDAMLRLDREVGFRSHFATDDIDVLQRLSEDATNEEAFKLYKKNVKIGYDPTEGVIRMEVVAADPEVSKSFSEKLLTFAEERVNNLSQGVREDSMRDANLAFQEAQAARRAAQEALIKLQVENGVDPEGVIAAIRAQITNYESLLIEKELELAALLDNARPNRAKVEGAQGDVRRLQVQLDKLNSRMTSATEGENSLAQQAVTLSLAQADLAAADVTLQAAQTQMDQARTEASRKVRYLTISERPVAPQEATYPRKFENTILAFLVFAGIYLMLSLTASILREQVTS